MSAIPGLIERMRWLGARALKNKKFVIIAALLLFIFFYALFDNNGILTRWQLTSRRNALQEKVQKLEEENKKLNEDIRKMESDKKAIEKVAREKYGMTKEGETVYRPRPISSDKEKK
jgi:cell division protein FtsB